MYPWISHTHYFWLQFCEKKCGLYMDVYGNCGSVLDEGRNWKLFFVHWRTGSGLNAVFFLGFRPSGWVTVHTESRTKGCRMAYLVSATYTFRHHLLVIVVGALLAFRWVEQHRDTGTVVF